MPSLRWNLALADLSEPGMMEHDRLRSLRSLTLAHESAPKWSGSLEAQIDVLSRAVENNPGEEWPFGYYRELIEPGLDMKMWGDKALLRLGCTGSCRTYLPYGLILLALFLVILARLQVVRD